MIKLNQGDTSDIIVLEDKSGPDLRDENWEAELTVVSSNDNIRPLIRKYFAKDIKSNIFFTILFPRETVKLVPGRYIIAFQITNVKLGYRKEIRDKLLVKPQVVWNRNNEEFYCELPAKCIYTKDGNFPDDNEFRLGSI